MLLVRKIAVDQFDAKSVRTGSSYAELRRAFVPVWLVHRYQVESAAKLIAGTNYQYGVVANGRAPNATPVERALQRRALEVLLECLDPNRLTVPSRLSSLLTSADQGNPDPQFNREVLKTAGPSIFDPLVAADVAAQIVLDTVLDSARMTRAVVQNGYDSELAGPDELITAVLGKVLAGTGTAIGRRIAYRAIITVARLQDASDPEVAMIAQASIRTLILRWHKSRSGTAEDKWKREIAELMSDRIELRKRIEETRFAPTVPPGMPIG